jgi:hypothetical protein
MEFLQALLAAIPAAASSAYGLAAYALATFACVFFIWRVVRNKNLLENLEKLPPEHRLAVLETDMGGVRLAKGLSPEQWLRAKTYRYYLAAFLAVCAAVVVVVLFAGVQGVQINNAVTNISNDFRQTNNQPLSEEDRQLMREAVAALKARDPSREQAAVNQLSAPARAAYLRAAPAIRETSRPGSPAGSSSTGTPPPTMAQAPTAATETEPNNDILSANEVPINSVISAALENGSDVDYFTFVMPGDKRDIIDLSLENGSASLQPIITMYNQDKTADWPQKNTTGGGDVTYQFVAQPGSRYYVAVSSNSGFGKYRLTIKPRQAYDRYEPNDDILSASAIEIGQTTIEANIMDKDDVDYFRFETESQTKLAVVLENRSATLAPIITIYNPDKSADWPRKNTTKGGDVSYQFEAKPNSRYYVAVSAEAGYGKYALTVRAQ